MKRHTAMLVGAVFLCAVCVGSSGETLGRDALQVKDLTPVTIHAAPQHPPVAIVRDGAALAEVYVADAQPSKNLAILLKELLEVVKLSTGAELEVVHYSDAPVFRKREYYPWGAFEVPRGGEGGKRNAEAIPAGLDKIDVTVFLAGLRMGNSCPYMIKVHDPQNIWKNQALIDAHKTMFCKKQNGERNFSVLCYSSPETLDFLLAGCEAFWDKGQMTIPRWHNHYVSWVTTTSVTISPFDEPVGCFCENCRKLYDPNGGNFGTASKVMGVFVKKFAEEVKRRWPDKKVMYLPYWNYMSCPEEIVFPDNLEVQMCTEAFALLKQPKTRGMMEKNMRDEGPLEPGRGRRCGGSPKVPLCHVGLRVVCEGGQSPIGRQSQGHVSRVLQRRRRRCRSFYGEASLPIAPGCTTHSMHVVPMLALATRRGPIMNVRTTILFTCLVLPATAGIAEPQGRAWPYFRHAGVVVEPGKPLPAGLRLKNGSIELRLKKDNARVLVLGKKGQQLVHATIQRPAGAHVVIVWGENIPHYQPWVYVNGKNINWDERSRAAGKEAKEDVWRQSPPATITLEGEADELRVYPYSMTAARYGSTSRRSGSRRISSHHFAPPTWTTGRSRSPQRIRSSTTAA